jgi:hypothetical protein
MSQRISRMISIERHVGSCMHRLRRVRMLARMRALGFHCRCQLPESSSQQQALFLVHVERRRSVFAPNTKRFVMDALLHESARMGSPRLRLDQRMLLSKDFVESVVFLSLRIVLSIRQLTKLTCLQLSGKVQSGDELVGEMRIWPCCMARRQSLPLVLNFLS